jgi:hypothetical protein
MTEWGIDTLFNPGKRHMDEEKRRLQSTREEIGDSSGGRRIDLDSGTVTISRRPANPAAADQDEAMEETAEDQAADDEAADDEAADDEATDEAVAADEAAAEADRSASQQ